MWKRVHALYEEGCTLSAIAEQVGLKKNQVIGRLWRCGCCSTSAHSSTVRSRLDAIDVFPPIGGCLWPSGDPGGPDFHFCGSPQTRIERDGESIPAAYCRTHWDAAYRPLVAKDRQFIRKLVRSA